jgi:hypothetical protein
LTNRYLESDLSIEEKALTLEIKPVSTSYQTSCFLTNRHYLILPIKEKALKLKAILSLPAKSFFKNNFHTQKKP